MAEQGTEEKTASAGGESPAQDASSGEGTGRHAANDEASGNAAAEAQAPSEDPTTTSSSSGQKTEQKTEQSRSESSGTEQKTEQIAKDGSTPQRGQGDTSWAEPESAPSGTSRHRSIDVGELAWRTGNVLATVVRTLALLFALVLVVNVVLVLVGVNPANGVAQFVGAVADIVILGFRDLFVPSNPTVGLIVNSLIAAVFWAFVGELVSRLIRFVAARLG
jgi:hypothetical protein